MKVNFKMLFIVVTAVALNTACYAATSKDCVSCEIKKVSDSVQPDKAEAMKLKEDLAKPVALATKGPLVLNSNGVSRAPAEEKLTVEDYQDIYCHKFAQIEWQVISSLLEEMQNSGYPVDNYFKTSTCQPEGYSAAVKSPLSHIIADDPSKRVKFLDILWLYYTKKRKDPSKFVDMVNAKNTKGETLLDYLETMTKNGTYPSEGSQASVVQIIKVACSHGAIYSYYSDKKCPN